MNTQIPSLLRKGTSITFALEQAACICLMKPHLLKNWVTRRIIKPVIRGSTGRGITHRLSLRQLLGLATVCGLIKGARGCPRDYAIGVIQLFENMSDAALDHWIGKGTDERTEEAFDAWTCAPILADLGNPPLPGDDEMVDDIVNRQDRVLHMVLGYTERQTWTRG